MAEILNSFFRNLLGNDETPSRVIEVRADAFSSRPIIGQDDMLTLFAPKNDERDSKPDKKYYEITITKPGSVSGRHLMSLFRSELQEEAEERFQVYKDNIPPFIKLLKECSVSCLQKICDAVTLNSTWTPAHLAVYLGYADLLDIPEVKENVEVVDEHTGLTPIMVAVRSGNIKLVQKLINLKVALSSADFKGNYVYHHAAASCKDIIMILSENKAEGLNAYNNEGFTPFHLACKGDSPECVVALMLAGADVNLPQPPDDKERPPAILTDFISTSSSKLSMMDIKFGGSPLHWALSKEAVEALVKANCDLDFKNFNNRTPLHQMVTKTKFECLMALLSKGADPNVEDSDGNTPLHLAAKEPNVAITQALVVFGADLNARNNLGATARHLIPVKMSNSAYDKILYVLNAIGAERCSELMVGCKESCAAGGHYNGVPELTTPANNNTRDSIYMLLTNTGLQGARETMNSGRLLCLDGGGLKGLLLVQILLTFEQLLERPIIECFDFIAGTSTGGILALGLAGGLNLRQCQRIYFRMKEEAFIGIRPYDDSGFEDILKEVLGENKPMRGYGKPNIMVLATRADQKPVELHLFRNYASAKEILLEAQGKPVPVDTTCSWQAARATGAAPTYFRAFGNFLDGGLIATNPTLDALSELTELSLALKEAGRHEEALKAQPKVVISIGTGMDPVEQLKDIDVFKPESIWDTARIASGLGAIVSMLIDQVTMADGTVVHRARAWCASYGAAFARYCPRLTRSLALDERDNAHLVSACWETMVYAHNNINEFKQLACFLRE